MKAIAKSIFYFLFVVVSTSCTNKPSKKGDSIIGAKFEKLSEISQLSNYTKVSDTVIYDNNLQAKHGILHLKNKKADLILFKTIKPDSKNEKIISSILDTLIIRNLNEQEQVTIGYCYINNENNENLIAVTEKTDSLIIQKIKKVWKANTATEKIEIVKDLTQINCINEWHEGNNASISLNISE